MTHKPKVGMKIKELVTGRRLGPVEWTVSESSLGNSKIKLTHLSQVKEVEWATYDAWIIRPNSEFDHDMRDPSILYRSDFFSGIIIRQKWQDAIVKAWEMITSYINNYLNQVARNNFSTLDRSSLPCIIEKGQNLTATGKQFEPAQWTYTWIESGSGPEARRIWTIQVDSDDPLPEKDQEPHVGWTVQARTNSIYLQQVTKVNGHVWLNAVPVKRI